MTKIEKTLKDLGIKIELDSTGIKKSFSDVLDELSKKVCESDLNFVNNAPHYEEKKVSEAQKFVNYVVEKRKAYGIVYNTYIIGGIASSKLLPLNHKTELFDTEDDMLVRLGELKDNCCIGDIELYTFVPTFKREEYKNTYMGTQIKGNKVLSDLINKVHDEMKVYNSPFLEKELKNLAEYVKKNIVKDINNEDFIKELKKFMQMAEIRLMNSENKNYE